MPDRAAGMLAVSGAMKRAMVLLGMTDEKISIRCTGIDKDRFEPVDWETVKKKLGAGGNFIVTIGGLIEGKDRELIIDALQHVPDTILWCVGEGPDRNRSEKRIAEPEKVTA